MNKRHNVILIFGIITVLLGLYITGCDKELWEETDSNPPPATEAQKTPVDKQVEPIEPQPVDIRSDLPGLEINIDEEIDHVDDGPDFLLYTVEIKNLEVHPDQEVGVHFVYELTMPTGEATYLLNDPTDPSSGVVEDENGPVMYRIVETVEKRIENWADPEQMIRSFSIKQPDTAYKISYWVEVVTRQQSRIFERQIMDVPYITVSDLIMQGGQIITIPE